MSDPVKPIIYYVDRRRAEPHPVGARRGREVVEPGVRSGRIPQRLPGRGDAGRRRPDGRALQHDHLGASIDPRLELRIVDRRSAHRRDHERPRLTRIAARTAGLPDRRRPALAVHHRHREADDIAKMASRAACKPAVGARGRPHARAVGTTTTTARTAAHSVHGLSAPDDEPALQRHHGSVRRSTPTSIGEWDKVAIRYGYGVYPATPARPPNCARSSTTPGPRTLAYMTNQDMDRHPQRRSVEQRHRLARPSSIA